MKLYVVYDYFRYEGYGSPDAIFTDLEKAKEFARKMAKGKGSYYEVNVDEIVPDTCDPGDTVYHLIGYNWA